MTRRFLCLALSLWALLGGGCWDREELENLGLVLALGIDARPGNKVEVTAQVAIPVRLSPGGGEGSGGEGPPTQLVTESAGSVPEALRAINCKVNRRLTLVQNRLLVFGEDTAKRGLAPYLSLVTRHREFRRTMQIVVAKGRARELMSLEPELEKNPAEYLLDLVRLARYTGETDLVSINEFVRRLEELGASPYAPYLSPPTQTKGEGRDGGKTLTVDGLAIFDGDRMIGVYDPEEVGPFLMLAGRFEESVRSIPDPHDRSKRLVLMITSAQPQIRPYLQDGQAAARVEVRLEADLLGVETAENYTTGQHERLVERALSRNIQRDLERVVRKAQKELGVDAFGLGEHFRPLVPAWPDWIGLNWRARFPEVPIKVRVRTYLRRFGFQRQPPVPSH